MVMHQSQNVFMGHSNQRNVHSTNKHTSNNISLLTEHVFEKVYQYEYLSVCDWSALVHTWQQVSWSCLFQRLHLLMNVTRRVGVAVLAINN